MIEAKEYLFQIPMWSKKKNTLSDLKVWLDRLGIQEQSLHVIHVAGTNGKGSVCAFLTSVLLESGYKTGTFVSPHLVTIEERFLINGQPVKAELFQQGFDKIYNLSTEMSDENYCPLTFFEFVFLMAVWIFQYESVDLVILETGMGGRLDATNLFAKPWMTIITSISMDHTQYLGETLTEIAIEKAGIIKKAVPLVFDGSNPEVSRILTKQARLLAASSDEITCRCWRVLDRLENGIMVQWKRLDQSDLTATLSTIADYQISNAMLAIRALDRLQLSLVTQESMIRGLEMTRWSGRMEEILPGIYLDGAHNIGGIEAFVDTVKKKVVTTGKSVILLFAVMSDKDYSAMIELICQSLHIKHISVAHIQNTRGLSETNIVDVFTKKITCSIAGFATVDQALQDAMMNKNTEDLLFCTGSLYLIGELQALLRNPHN